MLIFTFSDQNGNVLHVSRQQPTSDCGGGCCFDKAVADFRTLYPRYVPGGMGVVITTKGV
ncbi:MAG: hypothetical protein Q8J89_13825 [Caulobacter sp.]|nr:hypothetical protein [Caulobacter sp.]